MRDRQSAVQEHEPERTNGSGRGEDLLAAQDGCVDRGHPSFVCYQKGFAVFSFWPTLGCHSFRPAVWLRTIQLVLTRTF